MSDRYRLIALGNDALVSELARLVQRENDLLSDFLAHLAELDERRLYLELGFTSMFAYCTEALGLCKSSAYRRIAAARVCRRYPEVFARVAAGELQTSVLAALCRYLTPENARELFAACSSKSCEQVEELLAIRFPRPDVRDSIRRLPARGARMHESVGSSMGNPNQPDELTIDRVRGTVAIDPHAALNDRVTGSTQTGSTQTGSTQTGSTQTGSTQTAPIQRKLEPLSDDRFGVHFTANGEFKRLLEEVRALASHRQPNGDLLGLMTKALEAYRRELQKSRFGVGRKARRGERMTVISSELAAGLAKRSRHVPADVAREVYLRDGGCCTFLAANGQRCGATKFLELDHIVPFAEQGASSAENLRLRCRAHNQLAARDHFGAEYVRARVAAPVRRSTEGSPMGTGR